jgi:hypothetical protein
VTATDASADGRLSDDEAELYDMIPRLEMTSPDGGRRVYEWEGEDYKISQELLIYMSSQSSCDVKVSKIEDRSTEAQSSSGYV